MSRAINLSKTSTNKISSYLNSLDDIDDIFYEKFFETVLKDVRRIKDCRENSIVDFYIETAQEMFPPENNTEWWNELKKSTRCKLVDKYVSKESFDNNVDIYFNEVKREYILHPMGESEELPFLPENRDIFIKNNLKLVIDCAKRYQNLGFPLEDLIQAGNLGLLTAFEKFDTSRANLRFAIIEDIQNSEADEFNYDESCELVRRNFIYSKTLDATLSKIPKEGFSNKEDFVKWAEDNIKKASFSSIAFAWIRAIILSQINQMGKIIRVPKSAQDKGVGSTNIIRLDSINPHTDDNYHDNQISEIANDEFLIEDENMEKMERQNLFRGMIDKILCKLPNIDRRIIKKRFGIGVPFQMSITEIAENEGISQNKVKTSINQSLKIIENCIGAKDKKLIQELLQ